MASSVASAPSTNILESLPARPPTPPREAVHETDSALSLFVQRNLAFDPRQGLQTPPKADSPTLSVATDSNPSPSRVRKKVGWSAHTEYREAPQFHKSLKPNISPLLSTPSSASSKPVKGILKPTPSPNPIALSLENEPDGSSSPVNIIDMLNSTIKQLAGSDRNSKLDAYMMLARALKASNNLPDRVALQDKMSLFMQFIQRDMTAKTTAGGLDSSLVNHSLTLLATFLHFPAIASTLNTEFGNFVMEHSIRSFEDEATPKDVVRHLMQVVAFQNFSPKVLTSDRVGRLVAAVHNIENYIKGKSIVMSRLYIYKRLIKQSQTHMATHCDWLKDMFTDMLSTVKDIRSQAISLGMEAGFTLRSERQLLRKVTEIFQTTNDAESYIDFYIHRLQSMIKERQACAAVPQIWSVVILFLRCPLDRWHYYGPWLTLVQSAFNMADSSTKQEANFAWNRYVFLTVSDSKVNPKTIGTLCQPLLSQLRRKTNPKQREEAMRLRRVVMGGICNLYYYIFAPGSDKSMPDVTWDVAVKPVINQLTSLDDKPEVLGDGIMQAASLLVSLLDVSTPRVWRQDRIVDPTPVKPDELPAIDSRWIRKNCDKVLECVGPIIRQKFCDLAHKDSLVSRLWQALVTSVTVASAKDIKVSEETAKFVACAFGLLSEVVMAAAAETDVALLHVKFLPSLSNYIQLLIDGLGILPFTEKRLSMTVDNTFEPVSTPSSRPDRTETPCGVVRMPLHHLFVMLSAIPSNDADDNIWIDFFQSVFGPFLKNKNTKGRLELTRELLQIIPRNTMSPAGPWLFTADCAKAVLEVQSPDTPTCSTDQMLGPDYREIVSLLERGLTSHLGMTATAWLPLLQAIAAHVASGFGDAGCCLVVVEPLAKAIYEFVTSSKDRPSPLILEAVVALFSLTKIPRDKQALEAARCKLWGAPISVLPKATPIHSLEALYKLGNYFLSYLYQHNDETSVINLQTGLCKWIQDEEAILAASNQSSLLNMITSMWDHICSRIVMHFQVEDVGMSQIEGLLTSGFKSKDSSIIQRTALTWNTIVKNDEDVTCSDNLKSIVSSVASSVDLFLHGGSGQSDGFRAQGSSVLRREVGLNVADSALVTMGKNVGSTDDTNVTGSSRLSLTRKRRLETTPETAQDKPTKRTSTSRLRHDNSQTQFERIASPSPQQEESQHLTERQKEVRERQRSTTALYSDLSSTSPPATDHVLSHCNRTDDASESDKQVQETTPKQNKSFEDLISSTPTPRRGEFLQLDDFNDPPSSPPIPRPYPLLSEIQSRSRTGPMEDWKFSSPPGSPVESKHEQTEDAEFTSSAAPTESASPIKSLLSSKKQQRVLNEARGQAVEVATGQVAGKGRAVAPEAVVQQAKLCEGVITRARKAHETPRPEDVTSVPVKSTSKRRSIRQSKLGNKREEHAASYIDVPLDASVMSHSKSEAETGDAEPLTIPPQLAETAANSTVRPVEPHECILVHTDSTCASSEQLRETAIEDLLPAVPSTPADVVEGTISSEPRRKRKRQSKTGDVVNKKRRSGVRGLTASPAPTVKATETSATAPEHAPAVATGVETRSSLRKRQLQGDSFEKKRAPSEPNRRSTTSYKTTDGGDTDEEVLSQLVSESQAASQQSQSRQENSVVEAARDDSLPNESLAKDCETHPRAGPVMDSVEKTASVIDSLRNGLEQLRSMSLTRDKVYEMEDILMDMKRELFEAERRGRVQGRPARPRRRSSRRR
ncbi:hypothetical protein E4U41_001551 [Claviceps citrina]|nr:hypothetical protein E4U41_001551 [Claviceps citrina]